MFMFKKVSIIVTIMVLVLFVAQYGKTETINKKCRQFVHSGDYIDLNSELGLSKYAGSELSEVTISYNMTRSNLEIDWLINRQTVFHSPLPQGFRMTSSYRFQQSISPTTNFGIRLTGPKGQIQLSGITAKVGPPAAEELKEPERPEAPPDREGKKVPPSKRPEPSAPPVSIGTDWISAAENWYIQSPSEINNSVTIEINGVGTFNGIIIAGPGIVIEQISGFDARGFPDNKPGVSKELPLIFEYQGPVANQLQNLHDKYMRGDSKALRNISVVVKNLRGEEQFRWNLEMRSLANIEPGSKGRKRYTFKHVGKPNNFVEIDRDPGGFPNEKSFNPATDKLIEIDGIGIFYAPVEIDDKNRTITITLDYIESGEIWQWVKETARGRDTRKALSIADWEPDKGEKNRVIYLNCFPIRYRQFTGFAQSNKAKERVIISYSKRE